MNYQLVSHEELAESIILGKQFDDFSGAIVAICFHARLYHALGEMRALDGVFSNEDCAGLEQSVGRWAAFKFSCRYLSGAELFLEAWNISRNISERGGPN